MAACQVSLEGPFPAQSVGGGALQEGPRRHPQSDPFGSLQSGKGSPMPRCPPPGKWAQGRVHQSLEEGEGAGEASSQGLPSAAFPSPSTARGRSKFPSPAEVLRALLHGSGPGNPARPASGLPFGREGALAIARRRKIAAPGGYPRAVLEGEGEGCLLQTGTLFRHPERSAPPPPPSSSPVPSFCSGLGVANGGLG